MVKLLPSGSQHEALKATLRRVNEACDYASEVAWEKGAFGNKYRLQQATYHPIKERFGLTAQIVIRLLAKVADAYKLDKKRKRAFRPLGAIAYDDRILRWYEDEVSIWTVADKARQRIPYVCDERTCILLASRRGESDLVYRGGKWYLLATVEVEEPTPGTPEDWLGVDLGVNNIASDSDGEIHTSERVEKSRRRYERIRSKLQAAGTKSAKRHLKKRSGKERRFKKDTNHVLSKQIVSKAKESDRGIIALEDLKGIRERTGKRLEKVATWSARQVGIRRASCLLRIQSPTRRDLARLRRCGLHLGSLQRMWTLREGQPSFAARVHLQGVWTRCPRRYQRCSEYSE
jgi:putative transposase